MTRMSGLRETPGESSRIPRTGSLIRIILLMIVSGLLFTGYTGICTASEPTMVISDYQVRPEVIMPGGTALITATVTNTAGAASMTTKSSGEFAESVTETKDINAYIDDVQLFGNGLQVDSGDYRRIGEVGPGQSITLTFMVTAPENSGIYFPELHIATQGGRSLKYPIPVNVNDDRLIQRNPAIEIRKEFPDRVIPGESARGKIILRNTGETAASEIFLNITSDNQEVSLTSPGSVHLGRLGPGDETPVNIEIITSEEATEGIHPVRCHIRFSSASGRISEQNEEIPVRVTGQHELSVSAVTTDPVRVQEGSPFSLIVRIENTGTGDADGVKARIETGINGTNEAFVGKIEPDNDAPAVFYLQHAPAGDLSIPITISSRNEPAILRDTIAITVSDKPGLPILPILLIIAIGTVGLFFWRRKGKSV
ncbi:MAG: hypothetical protein LUQ50_03600 [Methanospirillum sp.]|uniref:COG1361 S-layer family protein n=1 Tax=Methanospirillum sp. TaxID=45200 RepID=UPI002374E146|nr:hypothetical protein [Methanospirillum sp.]MDD1728138.1 hypothetical protein [Methanospirillum sp.]